MAILSMLFLYLIFALPIALLILFLGRRRAQWLRIEFFFILVPGLIYILLNFSGVLPNFTTDPILRRQILDAQMHGNPAKDFTIIVDLPLCGILGGLILLPRPLIRAASTKAKLLITAVSTTVATVFAVKIFFLTGVVFGP